MVHNDIQASLSKLTIKMTAYDLINFVRVMTSPGDEDIIGPRVLSDFLRRCNTHQKPCNENIAAMRIPETASVARYEFAEQHLQLTNPLVFSESMHPMPIARSEPLFPPFTDHDDTIGPRARSRHLSVQHLRCTACGTTSSPEWRNGPEGKKTLCNACGLRLSRRHRKQCDARKQAESAGGFSLNASQSAEEHVSLASVFDIGDLPSCVGLPCTGNVSQTVLISQSAIGSDVADERSIQLLVTASIFSG